MNYFPIFIPLVCICPLGAAKHMKLHSVTNRFVQKRITRRSGDAKTAGAEAVKSKYAAFHRVAQLLCSNSRRDKSVDLLIYPGQFHSGNN